MNLQKRLISLIFILVLAFTLVFSASAKTADERLSDNTNGLIAVSYRGDTENYPENSIEAILSAKELGAHMVSVGVAKTKGGTLILSENENIGNFCNADVDSIENAEWSDLQECRLYDNSGKLTEYKIATLAEALEKTEDIILILDIDPEDKDFVYDVVDGYEATHRVYLRFKESSKDMVEWVQSKKTKPNVIGIYSGNIIWNAISHVENLSECADIVQYQSKNYFNVMYGSWVGDRFSAESKARALAPAYDKELCGQRDDNESGWNELIEKGFSVIETNNIKALVGYISTADELNESLSVLLERAEKTDFEKYSDVSAGNLQKAMKNAEETLEKGVASSGELQKANSELLLALNRLNLSDGHESQKGALNVTAGKIIAAVLVGAALLSGQIYVHKMQGVKRKKI